MTKRPVKRLSGCTTDVVWAIYHLDTKAMRWMGKRARSGKPSGSLWAKTKESVGWDDSARAPRGWCATADINLTREEFKELVKAKAVKVVCPLPNDPDWPL